MEDKAMTITKFSENMFPSIPSFVDRMLGRDLTDWSYSNYAGPNATLPAVNVKENDEEFQIEVAAPGMKRDNFKVNYENGRLTISSESQEEHKEGNGEKYSRHEFSYRSFQRSFSVPERTVNADKIGAKYSEGILYITLPKREEVKPKPSREIKIS